MTTKDKYGNVDALLGEDSEVKSIPSTRRKRPSPGIAVMQGQTRPVSTTEKLKENLKQVEEEKNNLQSQLEQALQGASTGKPFVLAMPVTKQEVAFELKHVDTSLIDVSPENERIQEFLDEVALGDILPSIQKNGQQKPGIIRPTGEGRFELIEGSRRLACSKIIGVDYLALVGEVPDADIREMGTIENRHKDVSPYEKAVAYQRQIDIGDYENWNQLGAAKGISTSHISRFKACIELDKIFVQILRSPSDMPLTYAETIRALMKKGEGKLRDKAAELLEHRQSLEGSMEALEADEIIKQFKSAVRTKAKAPSVKRPVIYKSDDEKVVLKHSVTNKGASKFEIMGASKEVVEKLLKEITESLKVSQ